MIFVAAVLAATLASTPAEAAVLAAVQSFFDSMAAKDVEAAREVLVPEGRFFSVRIIDGEKVVRSLTNEEYLDGLAKSEGDWLERMWDPEVRIRGDLATVWTAYDFHLNGEFSHCGVDAFNLMKIEGTWRITGGSYTVEREGCEASPLGPVE
jgi:hypothetical protein